MHVEKNERRNYRKKKHLYDEEKKNNNNRTTILLVSIEVFSTATVTTEIHTAHMGLKRVHTTRTD